MKFIQLYLVCTVIILQIISSRLSLSERQESLISCLKLKKQAPYLNLNCGNILDNSAMQMENSKIEQEKDEFIKNVKPFSLDELKANTKKIEKKEEEKLFALIKNLKNKNDDTFLADIVSK